MTTKTLCSRGCKRGLFTNELEAGACSDCIKYDTHGLPRCNGCGVGLYVGDSIKQQLCRECDKPQQSKSYTGHTAYNQAYTMPQCTHKGMPKVFTLGKGEVYATGERDVWDWSKIDVVLSLNGSDLRIVTLNEAAETMLPTVRYKNIRVHESVPHISVEWFDGKAPPIDKAFIKDIIKLVSSGKRMLVHCVGGHGRTGTFLAAMVHIADLLPGKDPITWLRESYCEKAVETTPQLDWLAQMGIKSKCTSIWGAGVTVEPKPLQVSKSKTYTTKEETKAAKAVLEGGVDAYEDWKHLHGI